MKKYIVFFSLLVLASCYYDKEEELYPSPSGGGGCDTTAMTYATNIKPIFDQSCAMAGCHDATTKSSGYDLSNYTGSAAAAKSARFLGAINHTTGFSPMPKGMAKLSDCNISKITAWINAGTPQ